MNKFIQKAEELLVSLDYDLAHGASLDDNTIAVKGSDSIILDTKILLYEFGCEPLYESFRVLQFPTIRDVQNVLQKLIEVSEFRNKKTC